MAVVFLVAAVGLFLVAIRVGLAIAPKLTAWDDARVRREADTVDGGEGIAPDDDGTDEHRPAVEGVAPDAGGGDERRADVDGADGGGTAAGQAGGGDGD